jgi:Zn-dependent protease
VKSTYSLGRVAGIEIGLNWSVLGLLALLMWTLATGIFPSTNPGLGDHAYFSMAVVASLAFFGSILLHELGHALQARRDGMRIDGITLWLFGGVARFAGMFPSAGAEFRIAVAGPAVSAILGGGFVGLALIPRLPGQVDGVCAWLGFTNLALLLFNLIPALPLDGGRMLRAALWQRTGDLRRATVLAAGAGRVLATGLIGLGIALAAFGDAAGGIWLAFIGWFVLQAAGGEARYVAGSAPGALRVGDMMVTRPMTTTPDMTLAAFAETALATPPRAAYPVVGDGRALGLLPLRRLDEIPRSDWETRLVGECMLGRFEVPVLSVDDGIPAALAALEGTELESALVLEGERLVGLLSTADIARALRARAGAGASA